MSIENPITPMAPSPSPSLSMGAETQTKKNKDRASHDEKKRKREPKEDGIKSKSKAKKHKSSHAEKEHKSKSKKPESGNMVSQSSATYTEKSCPGSPFHLQTSTLYLPLAPVSQKFPLEGLCAEHLSPLLLSYYPPLGGVLLSYNNVRFSPHEFGDDGSKVVALETFDEYPVCWAWVTAEFLLFKPENGIWLEGYVNFQNEGHIGIVCWNMFNASIERKRLPEDWKWVGVEDMENGEHTEEVSEKYSDWAGYYVDGSGTKIEGVVKFRVKDVDMSHDRDKERGFLSIEGTMLDEDAEHILLATEEGSYRGRDRDPTIKRLLGPKGLGATSLGAGIPAEPDSMGGGKNGKKHSKQRY
ncbi:uncharacterized protein BP5553_03291 [Venustampulla echinocandica]|uniref:DNA-directed RNA polymerase subunit n=1 Tax=Venustampulla echinocandica TaxID=2656787 RepID=A0A370TTU5_9HELO|nr:uncharacterized protein BP5553_03291 [Venustampulla echinocandica]RDL38951.1 hypothetical protein BP5553_03291 [Venustampulla echinocandica]